MLKLKYKQIVTIGNFDRVKFLSNRVLFPVTFVSFLFIVFIHGKARRQRLRNASPIPAIRSQK